MHHEKNIYGAGYKVKSKSGTISSAHLITNQKKKYSCVHKNGVKHYFWKIICGFIFYTSAQERRS